MKSTLSQPTTPRRAESHGTPPHTATAPHSNWRSFSADQAVFRAGGVAPGVALYAPDPRPAAPHGPRRGRDCCGRCVMRAMYDDPRRAFLTLVPEDVRSQAQNILLARARDGAGTPQALYDGALAKLRERLGGWGAEDPALRTILGLLLRHRVEALDLCAWCLDWERLPRAE